MANYVVFVNESEQRISRVKIGFSWVCLFWLWLFAIPLFIRRVYPWAFGILIAQLILYAFDYRYGYHHFEQLYFQCWVNSIENCSIGWHTFHFVNRWGGMLMFILSVYFGFRGNEITARYYLKNGYKIAEPDSAIVKIAKINWHMPF